MAGASAILVGVAALSLYGVITAPERVDIPSDVRAVEVPKNATSTAPAETVAIATQAAPEQHTVSSQTNAQASVASEQSEAAPQTQTATAPELPAQTNENDQTSAVELTGEGTPETVVEADQTTVVQAAEDEEVSATAPASDQPEAQRPSFDLVRVDPDGSALIAGKADPGVTVEIILNGAVLDSVVADATGAFVAFVDVPTGAAPLPMHLNSVAQDGRRQPSEQTVLVVPPPKEEPSLPPKIVLADARGATIVQPAQPVATPTAVVATSNLAQVADFALSLETIAYDSEGEVILSGRGSGDQFVRVYVNNEVFETEAVPEDGTWRVVLADVNTGVHTLRIDEIDTQGTVMSRVESPFKREAPHKAAKTAASVTADAPRSNVTVQPGHTLWALAETTYGDGVRYVQILDANRDLIRNADLIYPGQVFDLPAQND